MGFPSNVLLGHNVIDDVVNVCRGLHFGKSGIIITGNQTYEAAGRKVEDLMSDKFDMSTVFTGDCDTASVELACTAAKEQNAGFVLAVGGGSKIDTAKLVAKRYSLQFVSIPTSIAHDGIASDRASFKNNGTSETVSAMPPTGIIADTGVILDAPYRHLASGCADVISNMSALKDWDLARRVRGETFSTSAYTLAAYAAESIQENCSKIRPGSEEGVWTALKPVIASGVSMCIAGSSRPTSGAEHMFSHALDRLHPGKALHGEQCGVGCIMMMYLHGADWKKVRGALRIIGAPTTASGLGLNKEDVVDALVRAKDMRDRYTILGEKGLTPETAEELARITEVI